MAHVTDGDTIFLDGGTTTEAMARFLAGREGVHVVTNNLLVVGALAANKVPVTLIGGDVRPSSMSVLGPLAQLALSRVSVDKAFLGADGVVAGRGLCEVSAEQAWLKECIVRQSAEQGLKATLFSGDGIVSNEFASIAGPSAEGTLNTFSPDPRANPAAVAVVDEFRKAGFEPESYTLYSYSSVQLIAEAITKANSTDPQKVAEVLKSGGPFETVIGPLSFDSKGDRTTADYVMWIWKKGDDGKITNVPL